MPKIESPRILPTTFSTIEVLMALPVMRPHEHQRWHIGTEVHAAGQAWQTCPIDCPNRGRWP
ncbi:MAG: hypothetical protein M3O78_05090, partial [Chloroflexota bacterium]|nr:hypothetical protein [Chloroflexota bacterium]